MNRQGMEFTGTYLIDSYNGKKYHIAHREGNRLYLCDCAQEFCFEDNIWNRIGRNVGWGYRNTKHSHKRNSEFWEIL